jgi:hypothetical protein
MSIHLPESWAANSLSDLQAVNVLMNQQKERKVSNLYILEQILADFGAKLTFYYLQKCYQ